MKKLSILLALIMALSCFSIAAFAIEVDSADPDVVAAAEDAKEEAKVEEPALGVNSGDEDDAEEAEEADDSADTDTTKATTTETPYVNFIVKVIYSVAHADGSYHDSKATTLPDSWARDSHSNWVDYKIVYYSLPEGTDVTAKMITDLLSSTAQNNGKKPANKDVTNGGSKPTMVIDGKEFVLNDYVFPGVELDRNGDGIYDDVQVDFETTPYYSTSLGHYTLKAGDNVGFLAYAAEIDDVATFAEVAASQLGGYQWNGVAKANVALVNELIKGFNASADVIAKELPEAVASNKAADGGKAVNGTTATSTSPKTGTSAVAGVAVVVLALATTTTVVLRKKED